MTAMTKKDAEQKMMPLMAAVLDAREVYSIAKQTTYTDPISAAKNVTTHAEILVNRMSEALAGANEIIRQGVA